MPTAYPNVNDLILSIQDRIKTNGAQEITGQVHQDVLLDIVLSTLYYLNNLPASVLNQYPPWDEFELYEGGVETVVRHNDKLWVFVSPTDDTGTEPGTDLATWVEVSALALAHFRNQDQYLDQDGPDESSAQEIRDHLDNTDIHSGSRSWLKPVIGSQNDPPALPGEGDRYIVGSGPSGAWTGHATEVATYQLGVWSFSPTEDGDAVIRLNVNGAIFLREGGLWVSYLIDRPWPTLAQVLATGNATGVTPVIMQSPLYYTASLIYHVAPGPCYLPVDQQPRILVDVAADAELTVGFPNMHDIEVILENNSGSTKAITYDAVWFEANAIAPTSIDDGEAIVLAIRPFGTTGKYVVTWCSKVGAGGVSDHGALTGLADDDHAQYHNDARGDARYPQLAGSYANPAWLTALAWAKLIGVPGTFPPSAHAHVSADITDASEGGLGSADAGKLVKFGGDGELKATAATGAIGAAIEALDNYALTVISQEYIAARIRSLDPADTFDIARFENQYGNGLSIQNDGSLIWLGGGQAATRTNLGLQIGVDVQAHSAVLAALAGASANGQSLVTAANYAAMRPLLGLVIGTNVQAYNAVLTTLAGASAFFQGLVALGDAGALLLGISALYSRTTPKSANFSLATTDRGRVLDITTGASTITVTLASAAAYGDGFVVVLRKADNGAGTVVTSPATVTLSAQYQSVTLRSDGAAWSVLQVHSVAMEVLANASANGQSLVTAADYAAMRALLSLGSLALVTPTGTPDGTKFLRDDNTWVTPPGGGSPGGSSGEIQYNNGGAFGGAANVAVDGGDLKLVTTTDPSAPTGGMVMYASSFASRLLPKIIGPNGISTALQVGLHGNSVILISPSSGTTAPSIIGGTLTTAATMSLAYSAGSSNKWASTQRKRFQTSTTAGNTSGMRTAYSHVHRGNAAEFGGWFFRAQIGANINLNGGQKFVGLCASTAALAGEPSALLNMCGMGYDAADASTGNWYFMRNDGSGTATKVDLGTDAARSTTSGWDFIMFMAPNGSDLYVKVTNIGTGVVVLDTSYNTDLPAVNTGLCIKAEVRNGAVAAADNLEVAKLYLETDY